MIKNKEINRDESATKIFDERTLESDYRALVPVLKPGMQVLDIGCGTGAISKDIAKRVAPGGHVTGIDNTEKFIVSGRDTYQDVQNLDLLHADLFSFQTEKKFDLIVAARVLQWLSNPKDALLKMKTWLKPGGMISILDYNHEAIEWRPSPPQSMRKFYNAFLGWRANAGMNNRIADDLSGYFAEAGLHSIEILPSNECYEAGETFKLGIWSKVAGMKQIVDEGFITEEERLQAIREYDQWIVSEAEEMTMKLNEVRGVLLS